MTASLTPRALELLTDPSAVVALATSDRAGRPHAVLDADVRPSGDGALLYLERLEGSRTQRDLVHALWFDRPVAVTVRRGGESYELLGRPVKSVVAGPEFRRHYEEVRAADPEVDLAAVWRIELLEVAELTYAHRRARQELERPFLTHLDRLVRPT